MRVRKHFVFHGHVQGVGFRITMYQKAIKLGLTGWVKNCYNGNVEACVQGEEDKIKQMIAQMESIVYIQIDEVEEETLEVLDKEKSFELKY